MMTDVLSMKIRDAHQVEVASYWPQVEGRYIHIGLVYPKSNRILRYGFVVSSLILWFTLGTFYNYPVVALVIVIVGCKVVSRIIHKTRGYYIVDQLGYPTRFYSKAPPWQIKGRPPLLRQKFLENIITSLLEQQ